MDCFRKSRSLYIKVVVIWVCIILLISLLLTMKSASDLVSLTVLPEFPRKGEPVLVTFKLINPYSRSIDASYYFYVNGKLLRYGRANLAPFSSKIYKYVYSLPISIGEGIVFKVMATCENKNYEKIISVPPFPPQVCSSFISFASFSTSVMSSMVASPYYEDNFVSARGINTGLVLSLCLILLLIALELAGAVSEDENDPVRLQRTGMLMLMRFKDKFNFLIWILLIIFIGIVYTKIVMILAVY